MTPDEIAAKLEETTFGTDPLEYRQAIRDAAAILRAFPEMLEALEDAVARLAKRGPDHACGECEPRPRRGHVKPGFRCVRHSLSAALRAAREAVKP